MRTIRALERWVEGIERAGALDGPAGVLHSVLSKVIRSGPVEDVLSGTPSGHPLHPMVVTVPIGAWTSALVLDATGAEDAARRLVGAGCLAALPAAASGASDWLSTDGAERRVGLVHAAVNYTALAIYAGSWVARRRGRRGRGVALSLAGAGVLGVGGWLGGHLVYAQGVGVDATAFQQLPTDWVDAGAEADVPPPGELAAVEADGIPLLVTRRGDRIVALADRCTHRGAPLHEGRTVDGCVLCPWHGSSFDLDDGSVRSGPATRPQPVFQTRVRAGRLEVRREESRALRTNPVGR